MKFGAFITAAILSCLIIAMELNAEMKITPDGATTPNNEASLRLSGSFTTGPTDNYPAGAVISGENTYDEGSPYSYGGYFSTSSNYSSGVHARATGYYVMGVEGHAFGAQGHGVYGLASTTGDYPNYGGYFKSDGQKGYGVYGWATNGGAYENCGGYFRADGTSGRGVYAIAPKYGGYFTVDGYQGRAVYATATASNSIGVYGKATGANSTGVWGEGVNYDFYANGPGTNYGSFTGAHDVKFAKDMAEDILPGLITSVTGRTEIREGKNGSISLSSTLPTVTISKKANDKKVFGVIVSNSPLPQDHWYKVEDGERFGIVNAVGEGRVWVTNRNGNIEAGDYITTSGISGHGMLQDDDLLHSYTLGKAIETVDWGQVTETVEHDGQTYKRYLIAIVYTSG